MSSSWCCSFWGAQLDSRQLSKIASSAFQTRTNPLLLVVDGLFQTNKFHVLAVFVGRAGRVVVQQDGQLSGAARVTQKFARELLALTTEILQRNKLHPAIMLLLLRNSLKEREEFQRLIFGFRRKTVCVKFRGKDRKRKSLPIYAG